MKVTASLSILFATESGCLRALWAMHRHLSRFVNITEASRPRCVRTSRVWCIVARRKMQRLVSKTVVNPLSFSGSNTNHNFSILRQHKHSLLCPRGQAGRIVMSMSVCLSARTIRKPHGWMSTISVLVVCGRGSVLPWRCCYTLCTSGFVDDVTCSHNGPYVYS